MPMSDDEEVAQYVSQQPARSLPKGILSLVVGRDPNAQCDSYDMLHFPRTPHAIRMRRIRHKKRDQNRSSSAGAEFGSNALASSSICTTTANPYRPGDAEFTLIYFCELDCVNSRRFTFILADFLKDASLTGANAYQLICVLNDDINQVKRSRVEDGSIISHLQTETQLWHLGYDHIHRLAILRYVFFFPFLNPFAAFVEVTDSIVFRLKVFFLVTNFIITCCNRMLSITRVPSLVVIENKTGRVITSNGLEAIEWCSVGNSSFIFSSWRNGESAVPWAASISNVCSVS